MPAEQLEVVVQGRPPKNPVRTRVVDAVALFPVLVRVALEDHRHRLGREHGADEGEQKLRLQQNSNSA